MLAGKRSVMARAVDGRTVAWVESADEETHRPADRLLVLHEVRDLDVAIPPPESIDYHQLSYVQRLAARAVIELDGVVPDHSAGAVQVWRYRAAGDLLPADRRGAWPRVHAGRRIGPPRA